MRKTTKALLLSALVFPGTGQLVLERRVLAYVLIAVAGLAAITIFGYVFSSAMQIVDHITSGEVPAEFLVIRRMVAQQQAAVDSQWLNLATAAFVIAWLIGIIDTYRRPEK